MLYKVSSEAVVESFFDHIKTTHADMIRRGYLDEVHGYWSRLAVRLSQLQPEADPFPVGRRVLVGGYHGDAKHKRGVIADEAVPEWVALRSEHRMVQLDDGGEPKPFRMNCLEPDELLESTGAAYEPMEQADKEMTAAVLRMAADGYELKPKPLVYAMSSRPGMFSTTVILKKDEVEKVQAVFEEECAPVERIHCHVCGDEIHAVPAFGERAWVATGFAVTGSLRRFCGECIGDDWLSTDYISLARSTLESQVANGGHDGRAAFQSCLRRVRLDGVLLKKLERDMAMLDRLGSSFAKTSGDRGESTYATYARTRNAKVDRFYIGLDTAEPSAR